MTDVGSRVSDNPEWVGDDVVSHSRAPRGVVDPMAVSRPERQGWDGAGRPVGWQVSSRDEDVLIAVARCGVLTWSQISRLFYDDVYRTTSRRVNYMLDAGLLSEDRSFDNQWGRVYTITRRGIELVREYMWFPLTPYEISTKDLTHMLALADVVLRLEQRGQQTVTEREIRFAERRDGLSEQLARSLVGDDARSVTDGNGYQRWLVPSMGSGGVHYPDALVVNDGKLCSIEVELSPKEPARIRSVLHAYVRSRMFDQVFWMGTNEVQAQLRGRRTGGGRGGYQDGILQQVGFAASGDPNGWKGKRFTEFAPESGRGLFLVQRVNVLDEGVQFELDKKEVPPAYRMSKSVWRRKRAAWSEDEMLGAPRGVPFVKWLVDVDAVIGEGLARQERREQLAREEQLV